MADAEKTKTDAAAAPAPAKGGVMDKVNEFLDRPVTTCVESKARWPRRARTTPSSRRAHAIVRAGRDDRRRHREDHAYRRARGRRESRPRRAGERLAEGRRGRGRETAAVVSPPLLRSHTITRCASGTPRAAAPRPSPSRGPGRPWPRWSTLVLRSTPALRGPRQRRARRGPRRS